MNTLDYFKIITAIPRCSFKTDEMKDKIIEIAQKLGYTVSCDKSGNVLCQKGNPKVCLQSHYDMVCVGDFENIELIEKDGILKAKNSTLGADNGMGMAIMFACMEIYDDLECLFTNNEEVGLIGASNLELELLSDKLLNLDGEEAHEIYIGCAGGIDIVAKHSLEYIPLNSNEIIYEVNIEDFPGGHSGVDINKGIDSAIKVLARELVQYELKLLHFQGGEFRNSISKSAKAIVATPMELKFENSSLHVKNIDYKREYIQDGSNIIKVFDAFAQGVRKFDKSLNIPATSINLGTISIKDGVLHIECSARAMNNKDLKILANETESFFQLVGCKTSQGNFHAPWVPSTGAFSNVVKQEMKKVYDNADFCAIHAGLECGILMQKQLKNIEAIAIGPTIRFPHSLREECDLESVEKISLVVKRIIDVVN